MCQAQQGRSDGQVPGGGREGSVPLPLPGRSLPSFLGNLPSVAWLGATSGGMAASTLPQASLRVTSCLE